MDLNIPAGLDNVETVLGAFRNAPDRSCGIVHERKGLQCPLGTRVADCPHLFERLADEIDPKDQTHTPLVQLGLRIPSELQEDISIMVVDKLRQLLVVSGRPLAAKRVGHLGERLAFVNALLFQVDRRVNGVFKNARENPLPTSKAAQESVGAHRRRILDELLAIIRCPESDLAKPADVPKQEGTRHPEDAEVCDSLRQSLEGHPAAYATHLLTAIDVTDATQKIYLAQSRRRLQKRQPFIPSGRRLR